jgi:hypothetical protein
MMADLRVYWQEVRALASSLPQFAWLMSIEDAKRGMVGGRMAEVGAEQAARLLHTRSHRMATEDEISAHLIKEDQARRQSYHDGLRRRGIAVVTLPAAADKPAAPKRR